MGYSKGFEVEFLYLPMNWRKGTNMGYAFVSLVSPSEAFRFQIEFEGYSNWKCPSDRKCEVTWAEQQTLHGNIQRFRNCPVMHPDAPDEYKPLLFENGERIPFPPPTKHLKLPHG